MRALILLESLVVVALAAAILLQAPPAPPPPEVFPVARFLLDARPGERAVYSIDHGTASVEFAVLEADPGGPAGAPKTTVTRVDRDVSGTQVPSPQPTYVHRFVEHGFLPFLTPEEPTAYDRVWVLRRIRRETIRFRGRDLRCWRVECLDPGLPAGQDAVVVWMHEGVDVYGIVRFDRGGRTYECTSWSPPR